nr:unnamed protein product [Callosobruchus chinensis]
MWKVISVSSASAGMMKGSEMFRNSGWLVLLSFASMLMKG